MAVSPSEHEVSHDSQFQDNSKSTSSNGSLDNGDFSFSSVFSRRKAKNEGSVGLPPLSTESNTGNLDLQISLAPPLALDNHQTIGGQKQSSDGDGYRNLPHQFTNSYNNFQNSISNRPNITSLALEDAVNPLNENSATTRVAFGDAINSKIEGVAKAIKEAQLKTPNIEIVDNPAPKSNKLAWIDNKSPIESLFNLRSQGKTVPVPTELFSTSQNPIDEPDTKSKASIGLEDVTNLQNYRDHQYGRLREFSTVKESPDSTFAKDVFANLSGSPEEFLNRLKIDQVKRFSGTDTRHTKILNGERSGSCITARDFSSLETSFGPVGEVSTNEYDSYRRPLSKLEETYSEDGIHSYELSQFSYGQGTKVKPFADYTRVVKYANNKAQVQVFDNKGVKPELISENSWS